MFYAESSLSLLSESNLKRLERNGFKVLLPGIESWFDMGDKSKTGRKHGMDKVEQVADHLNMVMRYVPYVQANFVFGLDIDQGPEPFECTKRLVDLAPGAFPGYGLLSAFGQAVPLNLEYQRANRVLPFPFHFLNTQHAPNVRPKNYSWPQFYDHLIDLFQYSFSWRAVVHRYKAVRAPLPRWMNVLRSRSAQGVGRVKRFREMRRRLDSDRQFRDFFEQESTEVPQFYVEQLLRDLGPFQQWLPEGALRHDPTPTSRGKAGGSLTLTSPRTSASRGDQI